MRGVLWALLSLLIVGIMMGLFGWPFIPYRGWASYWAYRVLGVALAGLLLFSLFFVVDAILLAVQLIWALTECGTTWPEKAAQYWSRKPGGVGKTLDADVVEWLEIQFIARRTEVTGDLLYVPATILLLAIAGRFSYFENWGLPMSVMLVYLACAVLIAASAIGLVIVARRARRRALRNLKGQLRVAKFHAPRNEKRVARISYTSLKTSRL